MRGPHGPCKTYKAAQTIINRIQIPVLHSFHITQVTIFGSKRTPHIQKCQFFGIFIWELTAVALHIETFSQKYEILKVTNCKKLTLTKEAAFLVRIFHVFLWSCSKLEHWCYWEGCMVEANVTASRSNKGGQRFWKNLTFLLVGFIQIFWRIVRMLGLFYLQSNKVS